MAGTDSAEKRWQRFLTPFLLDPLGHSGTFAYDAADRQTSGTDRLGTVINDTYDALNRKTGETWVIGTVTNNTQTFTYDSANNLLSAADKNGTLTFTYDSLNRLSTQTDVFSQLLTNSYDAAGNRTLVQDSQGGTTTSVYDTLNRLTSRQLGGTAPVRIDETYTARDQVASQSRYTDVAGTHLVGTSSFTYDNDARLVTQQHKDASGNNIANYTYAYDVADRLTAQTLNGTTVSYAYDADNQLTQGGTSNYGYDSAGNRNTTGYSANADNEITNDGTWTYTYDSNGNMTKKSKGASADTWTFGYDARNRMVWAEDRATDGGSLITRLDYKYDVRDNRIEKDVTANSVTTVTHFATDNGNAWADLSGTNVLQTRRLFFDNLDSVYARISAAGVAAWYISDRQGSIQNIENYAGTAVQDAYTYDPYGQILTETTPANGDGYAYNGGVYERESKLQLNGVRWYNSSTGKWQTQDPDGFAAMDYNLYRYVFNGPTNATDPSGRFFIASTGAESRWADIFQNDYGITGVWVKIDPAWYKSDYRWGFVTSLDGVAKAQALLKKDPEYGVLKALADNTGTFNVQGSWGDGPYYWGTDLSGDERKTLRTAFWQAFDTKDDEKKLMGEFAAIQPITKDRLLAILKLRDPRIANYLAKSHDHFYVEGETKCAWEDEFSLKTSYHDGLGGQTSRLVFTYDKKKSTLRDASNWLIDQFHNGEWKSVWDPPRPTNAQIGEDQSKWSPQYAFLRAQEARAENLRAAGYNEFQIFLINSFGPGGTWDEVGAPMASLGGGGGWLQFENGRIARTD